MEINLNKKNNIEGSIKIRLNKSDYQPQVEKKVNEYARKASIKGFRPGKVPPGIIRKMYGKSILVEEVNNILSAKLSDFVKESELKLLGEPLPDKESTKLINWDYPDEMEFVYNIGIQDEFKLEVGPSHKIRRYNIENDKKSLEKTLSDIRKRFGKTVEGTSSEEGDTLEVDISDSGKTIDLKEKTLNLQALTKNALKKFKGLKKGDTINFPIEKLSDDIHVVMHLTSTEHGEAEKLKGDFSFTVLGIQRQEEAVHDQEFFDKVFGAGVVNSEDEYMEKVKETVSKNYERESDNYLNLSIRKYFLEKTEISLPEEFLKDWLKITDQNITEEDIEREFNGYIEGPKWDLIQNKVATDHNIQVDYDAVRERTKAMFIEQFGGKEASASIMESLDQIADNYLQNDNGKQFRAMYDNLRKEKIMDFIKGKVTISDKKVSEDEFSKIVKEGK